MFEKIRDSGPNLPPFTKTGRLTTRATEPGFSLPKGRQVLKPSVHFTKEVREAPKSRVSSPKSTMSFSGSLNSRHAGALLHPDFASDRTLKAEPDSYVRMLFLATEILLARIYTNSSSSASLPPYPPSYTFSIPSSALSNFTTPLHASSTVAVPHSRYRRQFSTHLLDYLTFDEYKSLRLTRRLWLPSLPPPRLTSLLQDA